MSLLEIHLVAKSYNQISLCQDRRRPRVLRSGAPIYSPNPLPEQDRWTNSNACFRSADADHAIVSECSAKVVRGCGGFQVPQGHLEGYRRNVYTCSLDISRF